MPDKHISFSDQILYILKDQSLLCINEPMSRHTSMQVGGIADFYTTPISYIQLAKLVHLAKQTGILYQIIGKGSNLIVRDGGIRGLVISTEKLQRMTIHKNYLMADCGVELKDICAFAADHGLSGLEFACGIPGTVGGAVYMNAGAYEGEISQVLDFTLSLDLLQITKTDEQEESGSKLYKGAFPYGLLPLENRDHAFSYRNSLLQTRPLILLYAVFLLSPAPKNRILAKMEELTLKREDKQPLDMPSAGSVFKRPEGHFTGKLIDDCGLKGYRIGGAAVSDKHCGFVVNLGNATAQDVLSLIKYVQDCVWDRHRVKLQTEVKVIGEA